MLTGTLFPYIDAENLSMYNEDIVYVTFCVGQLAQSLKSQTYHYYRILLVHVVVCAMIMRQVGLFCLKDSLLVIQE